jgi:uncharacterized protein DUF3471/DinB family protein
MRRRAALVIALVLPASIAAQTPPTRVPDGVVLSFERFADHYGGWLIAAFDSIPATRYDYRPTPPQQTIGYIAQHLEDANYGLCGRLGKLKAPRTAKDSLADTIKAKWPKDTLVARLKASLDFCDQAMERVAQVNSPAVASTLLGVETDLAEHYSQIAGYMRLLGMVPPSAIPQRKRTAIDLPATTLSQYAGVYELAPGLEFDVTMRDGALYIRSNSGGDAVHLWPESRSDFFVNEVDAQITFSRGPSGAVTGLILHQYGRDRPARKIR